MSSSIDYKRGILDILLANIINIMIGLIATFVLPKYLSLESYASIKTYHLYGSYAGMLAFGYTDGMYLKYGGQAFANLDKKDLYQNLSSFRIFQCVIVLTLLLWAIWYGDFVLIAFVLTIFPMNIATYFKSFYQAIGEFRKYSQIVNYNSFLTLIVNLGLLFVIRSTDSRMYIIAYVIIYIIIWLFLEVGIRKMLVVYPTAGFFSSNEVLISIKNGFLLMLGNFSNVILTSLDRWFIKALMDVTAFAQYSFACSVENFINIAITPITVTLYNYFCKENSLEQIHRIRNLVIVAGAFLISSAFPAKFILENYLKKYWNASNVIFLLFAAQFFYTLIKGIYVNLYKARRQQKKYFSKLIFVIAIAALLNWFLFSFVSKMEAFAVGTLLAAIVWFVLSAMDFRFLKYDIGEIFFIVMSTLCFLLCGYCFDSITGGLIYLSTLILLCLSTMRNSFVSLLKLFCRFFRASK